MLMKRLLLIIAILLATNVLFSKNVDLTTAQRAGANYMINILGSEVKAADFKLHHVYSNGDNQPLLYIFNAPGSFVIVSGNDAARPILAYSNDGEFVTKEMPENLTTWLNYYKREIEYAYAHSLEGSAEIQAQWETLTRRDADAATSNRGTRSGFYLLSTTWNQDTYYNDDCPTDSDGPNGHVYAGCVACAMSQIINYWEYPSVGQGSHSYVHPTYGSQSVNFAQTTFNYSLMPNALSYSSTQSQIDAIANLMRHCGVAVNMDYGADGSGAFDIAARAAFVSYFKYSSNISMAEKAYYSTSEWENLLKSELDLGRPIFYSGSGSGGHAFVCDGYDGNNNFHFNWGWGGYGDGYFALDAMNPSSGHDYNDDHTILINITPGNGADYPTLLLNTEGTTTQTIASETRIGHPLAYNQHSTTDYTNVTTDQLTLYPENASDQLLLRNISFEGQSLQIYDGVGTSGTLLLTLNTSNCGNIVTSTAHALTLVYSGHFYSDGFEVRVTPDEFSDCLAPTNLTADVSGSDINLSWQWEGTGDWITHIQSDYSHYYGFNGANSYSYAQRFTQSDLVDHVGKSLTKVSLGLGVSLSTYKLQLWTGTVNNLTLVYEQDLPTTNTGAWTDVILNTPFTIPANTEVWIGYTAGSVPASTYFWGVDDGPIVSNTSYVINNGYCYELEVGVGLAYNLAIRGFLENLSNTYKVYHGGSEIATVTGTSYIHSNAGMGEHCYTVKKVCDNELSDPSNQACVSINCPTPLNLTATAAAAENSIHLRWETETGEWESYAQDQLSDFYGFNSENSYSYAQRFTPDVLVPHIGKSITKMGIAVGLQLSTYKLQIWTGAINNLTLVYEQDVLNVNVGNWTEIVLNTPFVIPANTEVWIGYTAGQVPASTYFWGVDNGPIVSNTSYVINNGSCNELGAWLSCNLAIKGFIDDLSGTYTIYNENTELATVTGNTYTHTNLTPGTYYYTVKQICDGHLSTPSNQACANIFECSNPTNLTATAGDNQINLSWGTEAGEWKSHAQDQLSNFYGFNGENSYSYAQRFTPDVLVPHIGKSITKMGIAVGLQLSTYKLQIWIGAINNLTLVYEQDVPNVNVGNWTEIVLNTPFVIPANTEVWIGYTAGQVPAGTYFWGVDNGPIVSNTSYVINNGSCYELETGVGLSYNLAIKGFIDDLSGNYTIYQGGTAVATVTGNAYTHANLTPGTYCYTVRRNCGNTLSASSNQACATIDCPTFDFYGEPILHQGEPALYLYWNLVENATAYNIYLNGTFIGSSTDNDFITPSITQGTPYSFYVTPQFGNTECDYLYSRTITYQDPSISCNTPYNLAAIETNTGHNLTWDFGSPEPISWSSTIYTNIGTGNAVTFDCAQRWTNYDLANSIGKTISSITFFPAEENCTYTLKLWVGGNQIDGPEQLVYSQTVSGLTINQENTIPLTTPYTIDDDRCLWIGYECATTTGHPAGADAGPAVHGKGNMIYINGSWQPLTALNSELDFNWIIKAHLEDNATFNIYRDNTVIAQNIQGNTHSVSNEPQGSFCYTATAQCANSESGHSNSACVSNCNDVTSDFYQTACNSYTWNGQTYTQSGDYVQTFTTVNGCDSIVTLHLTISNIATFEFSASACDNYTWNGTTYNESGDYTQQFTTVNGCDSIVTLHLTISNIATTEFNVSACDSYTWNEMTYNESGDYTQEFTTVNGCDSVVTLHLTINYSATVTLEDSVFIHQEYHANGFDILTNDEEGTFEYTLNLTTEFGCDSIVTLNLTVIDNTGLDDLILNNIKVYPNPTTDHFFIATNSDILLQKVAVYNIYGALIHEVNDINSSDVQIQISNLAAGIYMVDITTSKGRIVKRITIRR